MLWDEFDDVCAHQVSNSLCQAIQLIVQCPLPKTFGFGVFDKMSMFQWFASGIINDGLCHVLLGILGILGDDIGATGMEVLPLQGCM